jgi:processive 1,2-diacylglycerol beta-glucosyltransferase
MKIIVFPLFRFPTGHLKVAEVLKSTIGEEYPDFDIEIIDFLSYCNIYLEKIVAFGYLKWIHLFPKVYKKFYHYVMNSGVNSKFRINFTLFSLYFEKKMLKLITNEKPTIIFCTHSFPSRIIGKIKQKGYLPHVTIVNVYTDFFINGVWATNEIDYHLVPHQNGKEELMSNYQIDQSRIYVTGIPIDRHFTLAKPTPKKGNKHVIVAGGNCGLFEVSQLFHEIANQRETIYTVLCGKNDELFVNLNKQNDEKIIPKKYIDSWEELSSIYQSADAIFTKPGGVTISEAMHMKLPIFIHSALPGQEEINLDFLLNEGLALKVPQENVSAYLDNILNDEIEINKLIKKTENYLGTLQAHSTVLKEIIREKQAKVYANSRY